MKGLQNWLTPFYAMMILGIVGIFYYPIGTSSSPILDLQGTWEICAPKSLDSQGNCHWSVTNIPSDAPASVMQEFSGWLIYRKAFPTPLDCIKATNACKLIIGEVGDAVEANLNGKVLGRHGDFPPNASYARNYSAVFDTGRDSFRTDGEQNTLTLIVHSFKKKQTGVRGGPVAVMSSVGAFRAARAHILAIVIIPLFEAVVLLFLAVMSGYLAHYHRITSRTISLFSLFCFSSSLFMFSVSETVREYVPIFYAGYLHYFFRSLYDWSNFAVIATFFFPNRRSLMRLNSLYAFPLLAYAGCLVGDLMHIQIVPGYSGFDTAIMIMRSTFPLVLLPWVLAIIGSLHEKKLNGRDSLVVTSYVALFGMQFFDVLQFFGVNLYTDFYFGRYFQTFAALVLGYLVTRRYQNEHTARQADLHARLKINESIARMTEMLAHDVRKPFSILRMGLGMLGGAKDPAGVKRILTKLVPEIDKAVSSVDGLIADVMEVGSTSTQLIQEPASPESLIEATLGEAFRIYPKANIAIAFDLRHTHMVNVHVQKVGRVFSNIVGNAVQAMGYKGDIWFKTRERDSLVEFCVGNSGSFIPQESLPKLFDAFFTSGKKGGTGLGLAIAQKVITAHGGRIWCESSKTLEHPDGKVEFFFTLPVAEGHQCKTTAALPKHSSDITRALAEIAAAAEGEKNVDKGELTLEADIIQVAKKLERPLKVLVVDDEPVYRSALATYLSRTPELATAVTVGLALGSTDATAAVADEAFDLVITDVDMGPTSLDGFELVRALRTSGLKCQICVHSNRIVAADNRRAIEAGADAFLPKPMARAQLLRLVLQAAQEATVLEPTLVAPVRQGAVAAGKPVVLVIDDNPFILDAWEEALKPEATVHTMAGLEDLQAKLASEPDFLASLTCVVTDMHLDGSSGSGLDVGRLIKSVRAALPVLLSSDGTFEAAELAGAVDRVISKEPVGFAGLESRDGIA